MPNLMPGLPGTKEAFGVSIVREDLSLRVPPDAIGHYQISDVDTVYLSTGHVGEGGFGMMAHHRAIRSVFAERVKEISETGRVHWSKDRAIVRLEMVDGVVVLDEDVMKAFHLKRGDRLLVVKSTTVNMGFTPVEIWTEKLERHGFEEAIENMKDLDVF